MGRGVRIDSSVVAAGARVGERASVIGSIVGERATIGAGSQVHGLAVVGPGAEVGEGNMLDHGVRIASDVTIPPGALTFS